MNKIRIGTVVLMITAMLFLSACSSSVTTLIPSLLKSGAEEAAPKQPTAAESAADEPPAPGLSANSNELLAAYEGTLEGIYRSVDPSVVNIRVVQKVETQGFNLDNLPGQFFPFSLPDMPEDQTPQYSEGMGSGFVWDKEGHIVTNNHVVENADKVEVTFTDGQTYSAKVIGSDAYSDLAVLEVDAPANLLVPVSMADSDQVNVGQMAIAIGNPFGLEGTMTVGIVSAMGRTLAAGEATVNGASFSIPDVIQTDAPINPGNSGGVLVDTAGAVIGVTTAIESPVRANAGIGFAVPSNLVKRVVPGLIKDGSYSHAYLGISGNTLTAELAKAMKLNEEQKGALVQEVSPGGPADKAGLVGSGKQVEIDGQTLRVGGDVITAVDGSPIRSMDDLIAYLFNNTEAGQKVTLTLLRDGKEMKAEATLEARPGNTTRERETDRQPAASGLWLGIQARTLTPEVAEAMNLPKDQKGLLVGEVVSGGPADEAGLRGSYKPVEIGGERVLVGGDVITAVDGEKIATVTELRGKFEGRKAGDEITLSVIRDGEEVEIGVKLANQPG